MQTALRPPHLFKLGLNVFLGVRSTSINYELRIQVLPWLEKAETPGVFLIAPQCLSQSEGFSQ